MHELLARLPDYLGGHLRLSLSALIVGVAISVPLGVLATRRRALESPLLAIAGVIQTVPALAMLAVMVPALAMLALPSIGFLPAFLGLTLYSILPILRNTVVGIRGVDRAITEAARGVGMTPWDRLRRVDFPLALPVIVAGIRTATVWTVGMATLSTPVGAPSLGNYIFSGLQTRNYPAVAVGCVAAAVLALSLDGLVRMLEQGVKAERRWLTAGATTALLVLAVWSGAGLAYGSNFGGAPIKIGAKTFTEQYILAEIIGQKIRAESDREAQVLSSLGSTVVFDALKNGAVDVYVGYTGTIYANVMKRDPQHVDRKVLVQEIDHWMQQNHGIRCLGAIGFENTYALAVRRDFAKRYRLHTISDLARVPPNTRFGADYEFFVRPEWRTLKASYDLGSLEERIMDPGLMYQALDGGDVDLITAYSTDGRIEAFDGALLRDDRSVLPNYDAILLVGPQLFWDAPEAVDALRSLLGSIDARQMRHLNLRVDVDGRSPASVAAEFLANQAKIEPSGPPKPSPSGSSGQ